MSGRAKEGKIEETGVCEVEDEIGEMRTCW